MYIKLVHSTNVQGKTWQYRYLFFFLLEKEAERVKEDLGSMVRSVYRPTSQWCQVSMSFFPSVSYWTVCVCFLCQYFYSRLCPFLSICNILYLKCIITLSLFVLKKIEVDMRNKQRITAKITDSYIFVINYKN